MRKLLLGYFISMKLTLTHRKLEIVVTGAVKFTENICAVISFLTELKTYGIQLR